MSRYGETPAPQEAKNTEAGAVAALLNQSQCPITQGLESLGVPIIIFQKTGEVKSLEHLLNAPRRARAAVTVRDHQSFIDYVQRHKEPGTIIFAEVGETGGSFTAIIDFHRPAIEETRLTLPQWGEHVCVYTCEFTPEWKRWFKLSGETLNQAQFALFVEENMFDIADPAPAQMLEIVKTLEATQGAKFKSAIRLDNGDRDFGYTVQTGATAGAQGNLQIPQSFKLRFAIFTNGPAYVIECRFRWNIGEGVLRLGYEIVKPHKVIELALIKAQTGIKEALDLPVLLGKGGVTKV